MILITLSGHDALIQYSWPSLYATYKNHMNHNLPYPILHNILSSQDGDGDYMEINVNSAEKGPSYISQVPHQKAAMMFGLELADGDRVNVSDLMIEYKPVAESVVCIWSFA